jgi:hypothetical protein
MGTRVAWVSPTLPPAHLAGVGILGGVCCVSPVWMFEGERKLDPRLRQILSAEPTVLPEPEAGSGR